MGWLKKLSGKTVALDTAPLIYFMEENSAFLDTVKPFFAAMERGDFQVVTSSITLAEVLVNPIKHDKLTLAEQYKELLLNAENLRLFPATTQIAELAARLRATHNLQTPDAIQIATALDQKADFLLTNDAKLSRLPQPQILVLADLA
jgi:predicted nucleic acid-binding protein